MSDDTIPECRCTAHPAGTDKKRWMIVAECTSDVVVFCCKRCSEITHTAVIQVRTLGNTRDRARYKAAEERRQMDPRLLKMLMARKRGGTRIREEDKSHA
jgi:hypothetical protein